MKKILISFPVKSYYLEFKNVIFFLLKKDYQLGIILSWLDSETEEIAKLLRMDCQVFIPPKELCYIDTANEKKRRDEEQNKYQIFLKDFLTTIRAKSYVKKIIKDFSPDFLFQGPFHSVCKIDNFLLNFKNAEFKKLCFSYSSYAGKKVKLTSFKNRIKENSIPKTYGVKYSLINRLVSFFLKRWIISLRSQSYFIFPPHFIIISLITNSSIKAPKRQPQRMYDRYYAFNNMQKKILIDDGIPESKILVAGIPRLDDVYSLFEKNKLKKFYKNLSLKFKQKYVIYNVNPLWEHNVKTRKFHFDLLNSHFDILKNKKIKIIISLHPLCDISDYEYLESNTNITISRKYNIYELYPFASFVLSHRCSTNILSLTFNKKVLISDPMNLFSNLEYQETFEMYKFDTVILTKNLSEFDEKFNSLYNDLKDDKHSKIKIKRASNLISNDLQTL